MSVAVAAVVAAAAAVATQWRLPSSAARLLLLCVWKAKGVDEVSCVSVPVSVWAGVGLISRVPCPCAGR